MGRESRFMSVLPTGSSLHMTKGRGRPLAGAQPRSRTSAGWTQRRDRLGKTPASRILFVYPFRATFIQRDFDLLQTFCEVRPFLFNHRSQYPALLESILSVDIVYCWFALPYAAVAAIEARALGKRVIVVAGGWDVAQIPEIGYGRLLTRRDLAIARVSLGWPELVLAFSESSKTAIREVAPKSPVSLAYLGVDPVQFHPSEKEDLVVTVAQVSRENVLRKGLRTFVEAAKEVPEVRFVVVGKHVDGAVHELRTVGATNVGFPGELSDIDLRDTLGRARVYVQASYTEGFGVAVAEAMASGCVPVVTQRGSLPEVVGDAGLYFEYGDSHALAKAIRVGLRSQVGAVARGRVLERFTMSRRLVALRDAVLGVARTSDFLRRGHRGD